MLDYSQPEFYRFSEDSVILSKKIVEHASSIPEIRELSVLDLGCGSGVIGIEILRNLAHKVNLVGCDIQAEFEDHFNLNAESFLNKQSQKCEFINSSFGELESKIGNKKFDIVVSNPPYFLPGEGRLSPDDKKNICRHFLHDSPGLLLSTIESFRKDSGIGMITGRFDSSFLDSVRIEYPSWEVQKIGKLSLLGIGSFLSPLNKN